MKINIHSAQFILPEQELEEDLGIAFRVFNSTVCRTSELSGLSFGGSKNTTISKRHNNSRSREIPLLSFGRAKEDEEAVFVWTRIMDEIVGIWSELKSAGQERAIKWIFLNALVNNYVQVLYCNYSSFKPDFQVSVPSELKQRQIPRSAVPCHL